MASTVTWRRSIISPNWVGDSETGWRAEFPLTGPAGELIDLRRVFLSHGIAALPPMRLDQTSWTFEITVPLVAHGARTLTIAQARPGQGVVSIAHGSVDAALASS